MKTKIKKGDSLDRLENIETDIDDLDSRISSVEDYSGEYVVQDELNDAIEEIEELKEKLEKMEKWIAACPEIKNRIVVDKIRERLKN